MRPLAGLLIVLLAACAPQLNARQQKVYGDIDACKAEHNLSGIGAVLVREDGWFSWETGSPHDHSMLVRCLRDKGDRFAGDAGTR